MTSVKVPNECGTATCSLSATQSRYRGEKGCGIQIFYDPFNCTDVTESNGVFTINGNNVFHELCCITSYTDMGFDRDQETDEGCLCDEQTFEDLGARKFTNMTVTFRDSLAFFNRGLSGGTLLDPGSSNIFQAWYDSDIISVVVRMPVYICQTAGNCRQLVDIWKVADMCVKSYTPESVEKNSYKEATLELVPQSFQHAIVDCSPTVGKIDANTFPIEIGTLTQQGCGCGSTVACVPPAATAPVVPEGALATTKKEAKK